MRLTTLIAAGLAALALAAGAAAAEPKKSAATGQSAPSLPNQHYCAKYGKADARLVLVGIDRSIGEVRPVDKVGIDAVSAAMWRSLKPGDRLQVFTIYDHPTTRRVLFDDCRPGTSWCLECRRFPPKEVEFDDNEFRTRVNDLITEVKSKGAPGKNAAKSAIASSIFAAVESSQAQVKSLLLMSDLLDSETLDLSPPSTLTAYLRQRRIDILRERKLIPALDGADVVVYGIGRDDRMPYPALGEAEITTLIDIWTEYFRRSGAKNILISR
ncbi:MAG: hypothetical protein ACM31L_15590 [Actinomycetota bacterium]